ncbi:MAG: MgtC/SapB family protein [Pseudobdellovibrionaceae bacterium]
MTEMEVLRLISFKMFFAVICGLIVGIERKINDSSAGFKTQILVCIGSMLFTTIPVMIKLPGEAPRVIAQIISGVGFLGAGAILHNKSTHVVGLTTAAWIWFTAAIGIIIGIGHGPAALFTTTTLVIVISGARRLERKFFCKVSDQEFDRDHSEHSSKKAG